MATPMMNPCQDNNSDGRMLSEISGIEPEKSPVESSEYGPAPDGGTTAWLVVAGGACLFFCCLGFANSFGTFVEYYLTHELQGESPGKIAWIGSLALFLQFASGLFGGPLFDRFGSRVIIPAATAYIFGVMILSLCTQYWQIMLVQGVLLGSVMGLLQFPVFAAVSHWFDKKRATAFGIIVSGSSVGGIVVPIVLSKMLNSSLGFVWTIRIIGFLMIPFLAFAFFTVKPRLPPRTTTFWIAEAYQDPKFLLLVAAMFFMFMGIFTPFFYLPTYAVSRGMDSTLSGYLLAILNAASTFGRIVPGVVADKYGRINVFVAAGVSTGIVSFCMNSVTTNAALIVFAIVFGFTSGAIVSGGSAVVSLCVDDPRNMGTYLGMGMSVAATGSLIGPPVNGTLVNQYGGFFQVSILSGALTILGGGIALIMKLRTPQGISGRV